MNSLRNGAFAARIAHPQGRFHGANMVRCGAAASTDELNSGGDEFSRITRHVLWRTEIYIAAFNGARHARVRLRSQGQGSQGAAALNRVEHGDRTDAAVNAKHIDVPFREPRRED